MYIYIQKNKFQQWNVFKYLSYKVNSMILITVHCDSANNHQLSLIHSHNILAEIINCLPILIFTFFFNIITLASMPIIILHFQTSLTAKRLQVIKFGQRDVNRSFGWVFLTDAFKKKEQASYCPFSPALFCFQFGMWKWWYESQEKRRLSL